jgi:hypothetical protein
MAYDPVDKHLVLFSGSGVENDTWTFSNGAWTELHQAVAPLARTYACMTWDAKDGYMLLFGGLVGGPIPYLANDTWEFVHGTWTQLYPTASPPAEEYAGCAYDAFDGYVVLFGGKTTTSDYTNQTWTFVHGNWAHQHPTATPAARQGEAVFYANHYIVMYGGRGNNTNASSGLCQPSFCPYLDDTWGFTGGQWIKLFPPLSPPGHLYASATANTTGDYGILFGGQLNKYKSYNSSQDATWVYSSQSWSNATTPYSPPPRFGAAFAYDPVSEYAVLFAGLSQTVQGAPLLDDTWTYAGGVWTNITPGSSGTQGHGGGSPSWSAAEWAAIFGGIVLVLVVVVVSVLLIRRRRQRGAPPASDSPSSPPTNP